MTEPQAIQAQQEIEDVLRRHGIWYSFTHEKQPDLKMIRFNDITIKVTAETAKQK